MKTVIGTCSNCGGKVESYKELWAGSGCPAPRCSRCGWVVKSEYGPVIPMQPKGMEMEPRIQVDAAEDEPDKDEFVEVLNYRPGTLPRFYIAKGPNKY